MRRTALAVIALVGSVLGAEAQSANTRDLINVNDRLNTICRGTSGENPVCEARDILTRVLNRMGQCYGKEGQIGADMKWHRCGRGSVRQP